MANTVANHGALWVQLDGPNTQPYLVTCVTASDVSQDQGEITTEYCDDHNREGKWNVAIRRQGPPGDMTFDVEGLRSTRPNRILQEFQAGATAFLPQKIGGKKDVFTSYDVATRVQDIFKTSIGATNIKSRNSNEATMINASFSGSPDSILDYFPLTLSRQTTTDSEDIKTIASPKIVSRGGFNGPVRKSDDILFAAGNAGSGVTANVLYSTDAGVTWTAATADPFGNDEHIASLVAFQISDTQIRVVAARGVTDASNPAEVAYATVDITSPDPSAWTAVNIASTNAEFVSYHTGLAQYGDNLWAVTDGGDIAKSTDKGVTWSLQGSPVTSALNVVRFRDSQVGIVGGASNVVAVTIDGGTNWTQKTGPSGQGSDAILAADIIDENRYWIGYNDGLLYYTNDNGVNWTQRTFTLPSGVTVLDQINDIVFLDQYTAFMCGMYTDTNEFGIVYRSVDGGYSWEMHTFGTTFVAGSPTGFNGLSVHDHSKAYIASDEIGSTGGLFSLLEPAAA